MATVRTVAGTALQSFPVPFPECLLHFPRWQRVDVKELLSTED